MEEKEWYFCDCGAKYSQPQSVTRHKEGGDCIKKRKSSEAQPQKTDSPEEAGILQLQLEEKSQEFEELLSSLQCCSYVK